MRSYRRQSVSYLGVQLSWSEQTAVSNTYKEVITLNNRLRQCKICGKQFQIIDRGWTRKYCYQCSPYENQNCSHAEAVTIKRRAIKNALIKFKGGKCERCGYNKCNRALEFHHLDPTQKDFGISKNLSKDFDILKQEVNKCILVCSNCHAEIHNELYEQGYSQFNPDI